MASEILENDSMFSVRQAPWHGLGVVIEDNPRTAEEAIVAAGLGWEVNPAEVSVNGEVVKGWKANVREDTKEVLGIVGDTYKIVSNREAFTFADYLMGDSAVKYETAGSLRNGRTVWALLNLPEYDLLGDRMASYLLLTNNHEGLSAIRVATVNVRVVCQNTLNMALSDVTKHWAINHKGDIEGRMREAAKSIGLHQSYVEALKKEAEVLSVERYARNQFLDFAEKVVYPFDEEAGKRGQTIREKNLTDLITRYDAEDLGNFGETKWKTVLTLSDHFYHQTGRGTQETGFMKVARGNGRFDVVYQQLLAA